ncbi:ATP-binding protein [Neptuniibacter pectenicola]|uniref:histidine kinase n=1 Tax=Neptuniibacter pectenicola TaxID=1806669 RepID=A0ABU9TT37_9GAMM
MKWYNRLFWKIFVSIWAVSFFVLLATIVFVGAVTEQDRFKDVITAKSEGYAEAMVEKYEHKGFKTLIPNLPRPRPKHRGEDDHERGPRPGPGPGAGPDKDKHEDFRRAVWLNISERVFITDIERQKKVIGFKNFKRDSDSLYVFNLTSESGRVYKVEVDLHWDASPLTHLLATVLSLQMVLILLIASIGALLVSAIVTRPLNLLREHSQAIYRGELDRRTDEKLRKRGDELGELARDFDRMADYVQQTITSHQRLMQDVSHELRAPLARLQAAAGIAEQRMGEDDKAVKRIIKECQRLDQLIGEILSLSRLEQMDGHGERVWLYSLLQEWVDDAHFTYPKRHFNLTMKSDCEVSINVKLLERAVNNILGNACKHTAEGVDIDLTVDKTDQCVLCIRDHGAGVSDAELAQLCNPFYRGQSQAKGYGLGLSIAQRAVERLGGTLTLRNHPNGGLEAIIGLPCSCPP